MSTPREYATEMWRLIQTNPAATLRPFAEGGLSNRCVAMALLVGTAGHHHVDRKLAWLRSVPLTLGVAPLQFLRDLADAYDKPPNPNIDPEDGSIIVRVVPAPVALPRAA